ncbi:MAG: [protein-PII] uridylyltransferase [Cellvibrionaceae bacterium]
MPNATLLEIPLLKTSHVPISFNQARFRTALTKTESIIEIFKAALEEINHHLDVRFKEGENVRNLVYERALLIDCILHYAWHQFSWSEQISLIAVGGYGRGELHPKSDIDLLLLTAENPDKRDHISSQSFLTLLWDIGLNIGHSVRTLSECLDIASKDISVTTTVMEARLLQGHNNLLNDLIAGIIPGKIWRNELFFLGKQKEQKARHKKYNDTEYNLEPNVKNAPGGLRDIQTIQWVAKRFFNVNSLAALEDKGFFTETEYTSLTHAEEFLWKVRYGLHMIAKRPEERLLFEYQKELALLFGYKDIDGKLAIERFMHDYYRAVLSVRSLNDVLLQFLGEIVVSESNEINITPINERFQLRNNFIEVVHANVFQENPSALLEIFVLSAHNKSITGIRAATIRLIRENCDLIDDGFRNNILNQTFFRRLLKAPYKLVTQLKRMKRHGVLGRYLPEFDRIIGQMQHDLFHIYTVDDHTLNVIEFMRRFTLPSSKKKYPFAVEIMTQVAEPELLYIAGLYHDIAKGRGGDHSTLGAEEAIQFCQRHHLSKRATHLISWLVEHHLTMSSTSQKKDLSDPEVIHQFAIMVGDQLHLDYLYLLTVADMNGTNPNIWNNWRASLLQQLYHETKRALRRGLENPIDREDVIAETQETAMEILNEQTNIDEQAVWELWQTAGDDYFLRETATDIVWHTKAILTQKDLEQPLVLIADHTIRGDYKVTQIFIRALSKNNVFAAATSALDQLQLNIQDARIYSTVSGYTMDTFYVLDDDDMPISDLLKNGAKICSAIIEELNLSENYSEIIKRRTPRQLKHFNAATRTGISNDLSHEHSILEVYSPDRPGFLARLARIFVEYNIELVTAKITTLGERLEDVFFITDKEGNRLSDPKICEALQDTIQSQLDAKTNDKIIDQ